jgi:tetratricopeptide (TPR) repeat protein
MLNARITIVVSLIVGAAAAASRGQDAMPSAAPTSTAATPDTQNHPAIAPPLNKPGDVTSIDPTLKGNDTFEIQQALSGALVFLTDAKNSQRAIERLPGWLHTLISEKRFDEVEQFTLAIINAHPTDLHLIELCQQMRIRAKLLQNKPQEALQLAKGLYNVCAMPNTSKAIEFISECLYDISSDHDPAGAVKRFKLEQIQGAAATQPSDSGANTLSRIQIDPKQYAPGLESANLVEDGWSAAMGLGNLLLLSGRPKQATSEFQKAYALASDNNLAAATEAVARAMRAEDGTVGRANAWILSLRPPEQAAQ